MNCALAKQDAAFIDSRIRAEAIKNPKSHPNLIWDATDAGFPALFRSVAARNPEWALQALQVRIGSGGEHGLVPGDLAPLFAAGGDVAGQCIELLPETAKPDDRTSGRSPGLRR